MMGVRLIAVVNAVAAILTVAFWALVHLRLFAAGAVVFAPFALFALWATVHLRRARDGFWAPNTLPSNRSTR